MKYNVLETAAVEASAGLHEIDAEIEQIEARKQSLRTIRESLETVGHDLFTVLSLISDDQLVKAGNETVAPTIALASEPAAVAEAEPEMESAPVFHAEVEAAPEVHVEEEPALELHLEAEPAPEAQEEPVAYTPAATFADEPVEEHAAFAEALPETQPEAQADDHQEALPESHEHEEWEHLAPVGVAAEAQDAKAPTFKDLLSQSKPYSLRNDGWPACKPVAQRALRDLL